MKEREKERPEVFELIRYVLVIRRQLSDFMTFEILPAVKIFAKNVQIQKLSLKGPF